MAFTPKLTYKGRPLVRCKNDIYYGSLSDPYVIFMQVLTSKEENGVQVADRIHVTLLSTDTTKSPIERMKKQSDKNGLWSALEIGTIWLEKSLLDAKKEAPFHIRETIVALVRYHGLPVWIMERENPVKKLCEASLRVDTRLLKMLAMADIQGRICKDKPALMESAELFEMLCREQDCWGKARSFATDHARFQYFHAEDGYIDYIPHDNFRCKVILLSGLPGMGKDHYIRTLPQDIPVISLDAIRRKYKVSPTDKAANGRVVQEAKEEARSYLRKEQGFVWNATNTSKQMRSQLIDLFLTYGAKVKIVYIEKPYEVWRKQNREREFMVPEAVLDTMLGKLEVPQLGEAHEVVYSV